MDASARLAPMRSGLGLILWAWVINLGLGVVNLVTTHALFSGSSGLDLFDAITRFVRAASRCTS